MSEKLALSKTEKLSGSHVNYYLQIVQLPNGTVTVECEDIIEFFKMEFALATVFKSLWRLCKLRQDLGKPGSTHLYEAEKCVYYSERTYAVSNRKIRYQNNIAKWFRRHLVEFGYGRYRRNSVVTIKDPKRLHPYSFMVHDLASSMTNSIFERDLFHAIFEVALARKKNPRLLLNEITAADRMKHYSDQLVKQEKETT